MGQRIYSDLVDDVEEELSRWFGSQAFGPRFISRLRFFVVVVVAVFLLFTFYSM